MEKNISEAVKIIHSSKQIVAFTGAGISAESGIPPFRGENGIWNQYDSRSLEIDYFLSHSEASWKIIREIFYSHFQRAKPNPSHIFLAKLESQYNLHSIITQNIDNLHHMAGSTVIYEFHGNSSRLLCTKCQETISILEVSLKTLPPKCACGGLLKPDFIFFGEPIPHYAYSKSMEAASTCDLMIIIGTAGEVMPANQIPLVASANKAKIIEINLEKSLYTPRITDIFLQGKASEISIALSQKLNLQSS
ncbi:MAG: NAD-dependent deacylase [Bacteroidales bacterium]|nr:NAD-dependent deacylase [Bacteroidales bacterium]